MKIALFAAKCFTAVALALGAVWLVTWYRDKPEPATYTVVPPVTPGVEIEMGQIKRWIEQNVADPRAQIVGTSQVLMVDQDELVAVRLRTMNALGGWVFTNLVFWQDRATRELMGQRVDDYKMVQRERLASMEPGDRVSLIDAQLRMLPASGE